MSRNRSSEELRLSLPFLEEAVTLLRHASPHAWACYLMGAAPFALGFVWFWSAMSNLSSMRAPALVWALPLAALHLWMRVWQSRFSALLFDARNGREAAPWTAADWIRAAVNQLGYGVPAFLALLPASLIMIPFGWVCAFYHTLTVTAHQPDAATRAWKAARHAPYQNHAMLSWLTLCGTVLFLNIVTVVLFAPGLIKLFIPVEWAFTRHPYWFFNSTALCVVAMLTYLVSDPLVKAVYVLRTFYGLSRATGEDILTDWRKLRGVAGTALVALLLTAAPLTAKADDTPIPSAVPTEAFSPAQGTLSADALGKQADRVLRHSRYDWRQLTRDAPEREHNSWLARQMQSLTDTISGWMKSIRKALRHFGRWWRSLFEKDNKDITPEPRSISTDTLTTILTVALLAIAGILLFMLWRARKQQPEPLDAATAVAPSAEPDVADETVTADALPDDEWLQLAARLRSEGEYRKAARAMFLGLLACLARRELLSLRVSKTTADYLRELRRRTAGHAFDETPFRQTARLFEAGWYGDHPVTEEALDAMRGNVEGYRHG